MRVFVTGATGCVGSHVVERLRRDGHEAIALVRASSDTRHLRGLGAALVVGDVTDRASIEHGLTGRDISAVVHAAAVVGSRGDWEHYEAVGVKGTENVVEAMQTAGVKRLIHVSSIAAYGMQDTPYAATEAEPIATKHPKWNHYSREKALAEHVVWAAHEAGKIAVTSMRPAIILGVRDRNVGPGLLANMASKRSSLVGDGRNRVAYLLAQDVADAIVLALQSPAAVGRAYNLASNDQRTQQDLYEVYARASGLEAPRRQTPLPVATFLGRFFNGVHKLLNRPGDPPADPIGAKIWGSDTMVDSTRAQTELGWVPSSDLEQGVRDWFAWHTQK